MKGKGTKVAVVISVGVLAGVLIAVTILNTQFFTFHEPIRPGCVSYDKASRMIKVSCNLTLSDVDYVIKNQSILKKETPDGIWFLNSSLTITKGATLSMTSPDVRWLKLSSQGKPIVIGQVFDEKEEFVEPLSIQVQGAFNADGIKITSWDPYKSSYSMQGEDGKLPRPYIVVLAGSYPSKITNSEIGYLGYNSSRKQGLSFYGGDRSIVANNKIHDLWYGFFSTNVGHINIDGNLVYNNQKYGIDPHLLSHDFRVTDNHIYNSRIGLICSLNCSNMIFENNTLDKNNLAGLMLSRNTVNSTVRYNNISFSGTGMSVSESHSNSVYGNIIVNSVEGLTIKSNSSHNKIEKNTILDSTDCGILVSDLAQGNIINETNIRNFENAGICLSKSANKNIFSDNEISGLGNFGINVKDRSVSNTFQGNVVHLADNAIRLYNNSGTLFIDNKIGNTNGHQYIISGNAVLNLSKTRFLGDRIRVASADSNIVQISDSGIINIMTKNAGSNSTDTYKYDTNIRPYVSKLTSSTLKIYSVGK